MDSPMEAVSKPKKQKRNISEYIKQAEDLLKGSQEELISSVEASQDISLNFMDDTPCIDETPMCDEKLKHTKNNWVKQLNEKLENIEAVANKNQVFISITVLLRLNAPFF